MHFLVQMKLDPYVSLVSITPHRAESMISLYSRIDPLEFHDTMSENLQSSQATKPSVKCTGSLQHQQHSSDTSSNSYVSMPLHCEYVTVDEQP